MSEPEPVNAAVGVALRDVDPNDIMIFFKHQLDSTANHMAAFTSKDRTDREAHQAHWDRLLRDEAIRKQTILLEGSVVGHIAGFDQAGQREVTYWIGREHWGQGIASKALVEFLRLETARPIHARAAKDNAASLQVLKKCGFRICGTDKGFANARGEGIEEYLLILAEAE